MTIQNNAATPPPLQWGGFATLLFGIVIAVLFVITQAVVLAIFVGINTPLDPGVDVHQIVQELTTNGFVLSICLFASTIICVPVIFLFILIRNRLTIREYLGIKFTAIKELSCWFCVVVLFIICYDLITHAVGRSIVPEFMMTAYKTARFQPLLWIALIILAPVSEEIFFRGFLFKGFQSTFLKSAGTVLLTSILWAFIHTQYDFYDKSFIIIIGIILGTARVKTGSILTTVCLHSFMNLVATIETAIVAS